MLETKLLPRPPAVSADGVFAGYASLFGAPDLGGDVVEPGAFAASLGARGPAGVRMLWQHDPGEPLGRWLRIAEDARGLAVVGRLALGVARARDVAALLAEGAVDGLSIGFRVVEARGGRPEKLPRPGGPGRPGPTGGRRLVRLDLWEISVVTFPMAPGARVAAPPPPPTLAPPALAGAIRRASSRLLAPAS